jgi:hypothetical protein
LKAQIFSLKSQAPLRRAIEDLLQENLYWKIEVENKIIDDEDWDSRTGLEMGRAYFRLLAASMVRVDDFSLEVENSLGKWGYWGYTGERGEYFVRLGDQIRTKVFPSVAVMDRMVMVPAGIHDAFDVPTGFSYLFRPLDLHGVQLVDFDDPKAIKDAVAKVAAQLGREIVTIGRRHMHVRDIRTPDLTELSQLLHVAGDFLGRFETEMIRPVPKLALDVTGEPVTLGAWSQVALEVRNESDYELGAVRAQIRGPRNVMRGPFARYLDLASGDPGDRTLRFEVRAQAAPFCPLEVLFLSDDAVQGFTFPCPLILDVA